MTEGWYSAAERVSGPRHEHGDELMGSGRAEIVGCAQSCSSLDPGGWLAGAGLALGLLLAAPDRVTHTHTRSPRHSYAVTSNTRQAGCTAFLSRGPLPGPCRVTCRFESDPAPARDLGAVYRTGVYATHPHPSDCPHSSPSKQASKQALWQPPQSHSQSASNLKGWG